MTTRVAINGFGRIGRAVFRIIHERDADMQVVAVNDLSDDDVLAYLLKHDTVMGEFDGEVSVADGVMTVDGQQIQMLMERDPAQLPWKELDVDVVIEATGVFRLRDQIQKHIDAGAKRVILTVPAKDPVDATIVLGVNEHQLGADDQIVSNASCTTNCLAPMAKVLDETFGIEHGTLTTVHAYTNDQRLADVPHSDLRRSRAATENIIPTSTGAAVAVGRVLPSLEGRITGMAMRVPVADGSTVDLTVKLKTPATVEGINAAFKAAAEGELEGILEYSEEALVSSDIIGNPYSAIFDAGATQVIDGTFVKIMAWYDNEWGYSNRVVDLIGRLEAFSQSG
jgi:glyceraldehyde 3-phosphate dehydrogenase